MFFDSKIKNRVCKTNISFTALNLLFYDSLSLSFNLTQKKKKAKVRIKYKYTSLFETMPS